MTASAIRIPTSRSRLWFGMFGGALPWLVHLVGASIIAEWGCLAGIDRQQFMGITAVAWSVIALSVAALAIALAATWSAYQTWRPYRDDVDVQAAEGEQPALDERGTDAFMARAGLWTSGLFVFIILVESVPIFYFLSDC